MSTSRKLIVRAALGIGIGLAFVPGSASAASPNKCDTPEERAQLAAASATVQAQCDCENARNHGTFVKCARAAIDALIANGDLSADCRGEARRCAARSTCGRPGTVTCCRTDKKGKTTCSIKHDATKCKAPKDGSACVSWKCSDLI